MKNKAYIWLQTLLWHVSGNAEGGAAILDLHSGALSHGQAFINVYSLENSQKLFSSGEMAVYKVVKTKIQHAIAQNFGLDAEALYLTHPTFFSKLTSSQPKTIHDEYWHPHVDKVNNQIHSADLWLPKIVNILMFISPVSFV